MKPLKMAAPGVTAVVLIVLIWQGVFTFGILELESFPPPTEVATALRKLVSDGDLTAPLLHTFWVVIAGSALAIAIGVAVGALLGLSRTAYRWGMASVDFLRTVPVVALLPITVLLWGPSTKSELIITTYAAAWVMAVNTAGAFAEVHPRLGDVSRTFQLGRLQAVRSVWLPAILPFILVGARLSVVVAALSATIAETLVNPQGLGWEIVRSQQALQPGKLWAFALVAGLFGYLLNLFLIWAVRIISPGSHLVTASRGV